MAAAAVLAAILLLAAAQSARADIPAECWAHIEAALEAEREYSRLGDERGRKARKIERSMTEAAQAGGMASLAVLQRFFDVDLPDFFRTILARDDAHKRAVEPLWDFMGCVRGEDRTVMEALADTACGELLPPLEPGGPEFASLLRPLYCGEGDMIITGTPRPEGDDLAASSGAARE